VECPARPAGQELETAALLTRRAVEREYEVVMNIEHDAFPTAPTLIARRTTDPSAGWINRDKLPMLIGAAGLSLVLALVAVYVNSFAALAIVVLAMLGVIAVVKPEMTTVFISFALYVNLPVVAIRYGGVPPALAGSIFLALALPMLHALLVRRQSIVITPPFILMTAYFGALLLSAVFSRDYRQSFERLISFAVEGYVLYFLFVNTIRTPATLKRVVWALILGGMLMGSLSIIQTVTGNYENEFFGLAQTKDAEVSIGEADFFDDKPTARRLAGPIGSKNRYAQIMLVLVPLAIVLAISSQSRFWKAVAAAAIIPIVAGVLLTYSRGAGLTLIAIMGALVVLRVLPIRKTIMFGVIAYVAVLIFLPGFAYRFNSVFDVTALLSEDVDEADAAIRGRATVNLVGIQILLDHPALGVGPGQSPLYTREIGNQIGFRWLETDRRLHNMFLEEAADTGLIGFGLFMAIVALTLKQLNSVRMKFRHTDPEYYYLSVGLIMAIFAYLASAMFLHLSYVRYYWFVMALSGAAAHILLRLPPTIPGTKETAGS
jgi:hypothetical protein